jgi:hypothetical protein
MKVTLEKKKQFIKELIANQGTCNILNNEDIKIVRAINKDMLLFNKHKNLILYVINLKFKKLIK